MSGTQRACWLIRVFRCFLMVLVQVEVKRGFAFTGASADVGCVSGAMCSHAMEMRSCTSESCLDRTQTNRELPCTRSICDEQIGGTHLCSSRTHNMVTDLSGSARVSVVLCWNLWNR